MSKQAAAASDNPPLVISLLGADCARASQSDAARSCRSQPDRPPQNIDDNYAMALTWFPSKDHRKLIAKKYESLPDQKKKFRTPQNWRREGELMKRKGAVRLSQAAWKLLRAFKNKPPGAMRLSRNVAESGSTL